MLWLLVSCLLTLASGFPFRTFEDWDKFGSFQVQAAKYAATSYPVCFYSPFLWQVCFPPDFHFFVSPQTLIAGQHCCLSTTLMRANFVKDCFIRQTIFDERNFNKISKGIIKKVKSETEKGRLSDNTNIEVNGEEVELGNFVKKENGVKTKESKVEDKNVETKNRIIRFSKEILDVSGENHAPEKTLLNKNFQDENISISCNLVNFWKGNLTEEKLKFRKVSEGENVCVEGAVVFKEVSHCTTKERKKKS